MNYDGALRISLSPYSKGWDYPQGRREAAGHAGEPGGLCEGLEHPHRGQEEAGARPRRLASLLNMNHTKVYEDSRGWRYRVMRGLGTI